MLRWLIGMVAIGTIFAVALAPRHSKLIRAATPFEKILEEGDHLAITLAQRQLGFRFDPAVPEHFRPRSPLVADLRATDIRELAFQTTSHGTAIVGSMKRIQRMRDGRPEDDNTLLVGFPGTGHLDFTGDTTDWVDPRSGAVYRLVSTWSLQDLTYQRFPYVLLREPRRIGEPVEAYILDTASAMWSPFAESEYWNQARDFEPESMSEEWDRDIESISSSPFFPVLQKVTNWHQEARAAHVARESWYAEQGFRRLSSDIELTKQPLEVSDAFELAEIHLNRELARRFQTDADFMYLEHHTQSATMGFFTRVKVEVEVEQFRRVRYPGAMIRLEVQVGDRILLVRSYQTSAFAHASGIYYAVELGRCDSELGRRLNTLMVSLPGVGAVSGASWWNEPVYNEGAVSSYRWAFAGPVSQGYRIPATADASASFESCELYAER
ncbi:MAG: hypothetical protein KF767_07955 [Bdellovibrionaceae bacterium]|nr:hypothetical protein [Pseudobdellovibrionaceae bacterium]